MSDAMAQTILSEASIRARMPGMRPIGLNVGGTNNNLTINGTMTPTASPYAGYLIKSLSLPNPDRLIFAHTWKPANTKCQVDVLGASVRANTATGGGADYVTLDAGASAADDFYNGKTVILKTGTGAGQARVITDYIGSSKRAYVTGVPWTTQPIAGTTFDIFDTIISNAPPGFDLQTIDYTAYPEINILCSLERLTGATSSPIMGTPIIPSVEKDWVSQVPVVVANATSTYATVLSTTGIVRLDSVGVAGGSVNGFVKITIDGILFYETPAGTDQSIPAGDTLFFSNVVSTSTLLVEHKSAGASSRCRVQWSR